MTVVYKICSAAEWRDAVAAGAYRGSAGDRRDGFIHLSAGHQVSETARRHFAGATDLILAAFDAEALGNALAWEASRGGDLFPHFYGALPVGNALWTAPLPWRDGTHQLPPDIE
jgi:uncharacterized protein (DUF952 family)